MKKTTFLSFLISFTLLFSSCGKETQTTTQGGGKLVIKLTSVPANNNEAILVQSLFPVETIVRYYPTKNNSGLVLTDTFNVTTGQNFPITIFGGSSTSCSKIYVESYLDGKLYKTKTFSVGGTPQNAWGGPSAICDYASPGVTANLGIPYNITID